MGQDDRTTPAPYMICGPNGAIPIYDECEVHTNCTVEILRNSKIGTKQSGRGGRVMKRSIRVVLKSGYSFSFLCDNMKTKITEGELLGYAYEGATANRPLFIRIGNVDAIIDEGNVEEEE